MHVDMDHFFTAVEEREHPSLRVSQLLWERILKEGELSARVIMKRESSCKIILDRREKDGW